MSKTPPAPIDDELREQLSALMDGELDDERSRFLLRRLSTDSELRGAWERWQLASASLKGQLVFHVDAGFAERVRGDTTGAPEESSRTSGASRFAPWRWVAGGAVAASVAVVALMTLEPMRPGPAAPVDVVETTSPASMAPSVVAPSRLTESDLRPQLYAPAQTVSAQPHGPFPHARYPTPADPRVQLYLILHHAPLQATGAGAFPPYVDIAEEADADPGVGQPRAELR